jgi:hypothetical protein
VREIYIPETLQHCNIVDIIDVFLLQGLVTGRGCNRISGERAVTGGHDPHERP